MGKEKRMENNKQPELPPYLVNIFFFLATVFTTLIAGTIQKGVNPMKDFSRLYLGIPFSFALLLILGIHEFGHYFMARQNKVKVTLPYFIPAPSLLGTFGAVIKIKEPMPNKKALLEIGAAGPLAGFIVALLVVLVGLSLSKVGHLPGPGSIILGESLLFQWLGKLFFGDLPSGYDVILHPIAFAGWIGLMVTALNLLPAGQLDGGHIAYSFLGEKHQLVAKFTLVFLLFMGALWRGWLVWAVLILLLGVRHPPPLEDMTELDPKRKIIALISLAILVVTFVPTPIKVVM